MLTVRLSVCKWIDYSTEGDFLGTKLFFIIIQNLYYFLKYGVGAPDGMIDGFLGGGIL